MEKHTFPLRGFIFLFFPQCGKQNNFSTAKFEFVERREFPQSFHRSINVEMWKNEWVQNSLVYRVKKI